MSSNDTSAEKRIVERLNFGGKTAKRVTWEAWEFTVGPDRVTVTNASYGFEKADHSYEISIEERGGVPVPATCECPADEYNEGYDCKHKVALATVGGPTVLEAATASNRTKESRDVRLRSDGGTVIAPAESEEVTCPNGDARCDGPDVDDLPCWPCYRTHVEGA